MTDESICERCGNDLPRIDITNFGDIEPRYIYGMCDCPPTPKPCCTFCRQPTDTRGFCDNIECFFVGQLVPEPEMRRIPSRPPPPRPNNPKRIRR